MMHMSTHMFKIPRGGAAVFNPRRRASRWAMKRPLGHRIRKVPTSRLLGRSPPLRPFPTASPTILSAACQGGLGDYRLFDPVVAGRALARTPDSALSTPYRRALDRVPAGFYAHRHVEPAGYTRAGCRFPQGHSSDAEAPPIGDRTARGHPNLLGSFEAAGRAST